MEVSVLHARADKRLNFRPCKDSIQDTEGMQREERSTTDDQIWFLPIVALGFVISQVTAINTSDVRNLWMVSTILGISYGSLFNVVPMLILEWFGMGRPFSSHSDLS